MHKELLFDLLEVERDVLRAKSCAHRHLMFNHHALLFTPWQWRDLASAHIVNKLSRQLVQSLFSQKSRIMFEVVERYKLHNIRSGIPLQFLREKSLRVSIQLIHLLEVRITDTHNDDSQWIV